MLRIKVRENGKWRVVSKFEDSEKDECLAAYNASPVPRMLIADEGIVHKQYTNNNFLYVGKR